MNDILLYAAGSSDALLYATQSLKRWGFPFATAPTKEVTHLLLPVPSLDSDGNIRGGIPLSSLLSKLSDTVVVIGGNLEHPALDGYSVVDLLKDPYYLASNASITAYCALKILLQKLPATLEHLPVLILGWGRIGKCLAALLRSAGAQVTVSARKDSDRAMLEALGYDTDTVPPTPAGYRAILNTVPQMILPQTLARAFPAECIKIDLASCPGIEGTDVIVARGLPGKDAPESSGKLIASTVTRLLFNKE